MRDIDFIAMRAGTEKWVRGCLVRRGTYLIESVKEKGRVSVRKETICEFTGLVTNTGVRIYENMVLSFKFSYIPYWEVVFRHGCFMVKSRTVVPEYHTFSEWKDKIENASTVVGYTFGDGFLRLFKDEEILSLNGKIYEKSNQD